MPLKHKFIPPADGLWPALIWALLIHVGVVALIEWDLPPMTDPPALDVVWVPTPESENEQALKQPDFLANANQTGGQGERRQRPRETSGAPIDQSSAQATQNQITDRARDAATRPERPLDLSGALPGRAGDGGWADQSQLLEANPRHKRINATTQEHRFAAYMDAWIKKVERVGQLHYPQQARRQGLSGSLVLSVDLLPSGEVEQVRIERSSGHAFLDDAAQEIVAMASPYAPLPIEPGELDRLTITRTWQFSSGGAFR